ncbi:putative regulator of septum formation [Nocardioides sp. J9]|uniref:septum formation family protein n=1 Tax=unclassified Nocardioides TaxID=2615069 RepID=UPI00048BEFDD|nr:MULTISPECIES: septum formation family protein [unclassified Nocardioides]TWG90678.1 putative regulator of septum formation [Nocardioides sp. J9]
MPTTSRLPRSVRRALTGALAAVLATSLVACSGDEPSSKDDQPVATQTPAPEPPPAPAVGACYKLPFDAAVAPTSEVEPVACSTAHTSETVAVGTIDAYVDGHLLAVDSDRVQEQVASACPQALTEYVGGNLRRLRLSMIRPVWFTPTVEDSDAGADWYRCDAVVLAGSSRLAELKRTLKGALDRPRSRERFAMCGTAAPDAKNFERVLCSDKHAWRAIDVVVFDQGRYPGERRVRAAGRTQCEDAAADIAEDPLAFEWGYEWPTREQWDMGQMFGRCWAPDQS